MGETDQIIRKHNMRLETIVIFTKLVAHLIVGVFTPWSAALGQWVNSGTWPDKIVWIGVILPASAIGGFGAVLAFLSGSWQGYQETKKQNDKGVEK